MPCNLRTAARWMIHLELWLGLHKNIVFLFFLFFFFLSFSPFCCIIHQCDSLYSKHLQFDNKLVPDITPILVRIRVGLKTKIILTHGGLGSGRSADHPILGVQAGTINIARYRLDFAFSNEIMEEGHKIVAGVTR